MYYTRIVIEVVEKSIAVEYMFQILGVIDVCRLINKDEFNQNLEMLVLCLFGQLRCSICEEICNRVLVAVSAARMLECVTNLYICYCSFNVDLQPELSSAGRFQTFNPLELLHHWIETCSYSRDPLGSSEVSFKFLSVCTNNLLGAIWSVGVIVHSNFEVYICCILTWAHAGITYSQVTSTQYKIYTHSCGLQVTCYIYQPYIQSCELQVTCYIYQPWIKLEKD